MGGGLESRCVGRVCGADGAVRSIIRTVHTTYAEALKTPTHPKTRCRKPMAPSAPHTRPTQRLSRPPPIQKFGAENHMLQLNI